MGVRCPGCATSPGGLSPPPPALTLAGPATAHAHDTLRAPETAILGAEHAAEHAMLRRLERSPAARRQLARAERAARRMAAATAGADPLDQVGRWTDWFGIKAMAINAAMLPTGKVLWFSYPWSPDYGPDLAHETVATLWDPAKGTGDAAFKAVPPTDANGDPVNLFCAGISFLADGQVLVTGGNLAYPAETGGKYAGLKDVYTFDPWTETWTPQPKMNHGRWYPSQLLLPDGRTFIMGGLDEFGYAAKNEDLELFNPPAQRGGLGSVSLLGPEGVLGDTGRPPVGDYYPHLFWMPSGRALVAGPYTNDSWWLDRPGDPADFTWTDIDNFPTRACGAARCSCPADPTARTRSCRSAGPTSRPPTPRASTRWRRRRRSPSTSRSARWTGDESLNVARSHLNTVLLPDSSMVTVGGGRGSVAADNRQYAVEPGDLQVELWDPATRDWRLGPAQHEYRAYHSTALLLPDGRVVSAGDDFHGPDFTHDTAEIYEPPYLFDGDALAPRPTIAAAPDAITWAQSFGVARHARAGRPRRRPRRPGRAERDDPRRRRQPARRAAAHRRAPGPARSAPRRRRAATWRRRASTCCSCSTTTGTPSVARWVRLGDPLARIPARRISPRSRRRPQPGHGHATKRSCPRCGRGSCAAGTGATCSCGSPAAAPRACASGCGSSTAATTSAAPRTSP